MLLQTVAAVLSLLVVAAAADSPPYLTVNATSPSFPSTTRSLEPAAATASNRLSTWTTLDARCDKMDYGENTRGGRRPLYRQRASASLSSMSRLIAMVTAVAPPPPFQALNATSPSFEEAPSSSSTDLESSAAASTATVCRDRFGTLPVARFALRSCAMSLSVCLCVCRRAYLQNYTQSLRSCAMSLSVCLSASISPKLHSVATLLRLVLVCLSVCLSVCLRAYLQNYTQSLRSCAMSLSVCLSVCLRAYLQNYTQSLRSCAMSLSVCLSVCPRAYLQNYTQSLRSCAMCYVYLGNATHSHRLLPCAAAGKVTVGLALCLHHSST